MYLGIDLGTSGVKALLLNDAGEILNQTTAAIDVSRPKPLWSEQNPEDWYTATEKALDELRQQQGSLADVKAIGLSGQMHGATLLDKNGKPLRPAILWNDGRCAEECRELEEAVPNSREITGNLAMPGFTAPKLAWVKKFESDTFAQVDKVLLPKDYLRYKLTGDFASDMSDSAGTLWLDVAKREWSEEMLTATHLSAKNMPKLYEGHQATGTLAKSLAEKWGMGEVPIAAGAGDNAAGAVGVGVTQPGDALLSLGTSGVYFVSNAKYSPNPEEAVHAFCHCLPNTWHQMSVILSAASCLDWLATLTNAASVVELLQELESTPSVMHIPHDNATPIFLPYLTGERTPHNNPHAKGVFFGMTASTERPPLTKAVLEGVAFAFADGQRALENADSEIKQVSAIGGGSRSTLWGQILADVLQRPLVFRSGGDVGPALGAARLAHLASLESSGNFDDSSIQDICPAPSVQAEVQPRNEASAEYQEKWQRYRTLYLNTQALM